MRAALTTTAAFLLLAGPALADGPVATAGGAGTAPPQASTPAPLPVEGALPASGPPVAMGPCGPEQVKPDGKLDTAPHGEVDLGVGTSGYRHVGGAVCQPIGQDGFVAASASYSQANPTYRRH